MLMDDQQEENKNKKDSCGQRHMVNAELSWCSFPENLTELMQTEIQTET